MLANFSQTWHKPSLSEGCSSVFKKGPRPVLRGDNLELLITCYYSYYLQEPFFRKS